ncbi:MAG TPA: alpha/beta hydrolase [Microbacteriaceae bacterium]|nr:alpha/beta hydrolase [Microbacteriaceae bacterium]
MIVPDAKEVLPGKSPIIGSLAEINALQAVLRSIDSDIQDYSSLASNSLYYLHQLEGVGIEKLILKIFEVLLPSSRSISHDITDARKAINKYGEVLEKLQCEARAILDIVDSELSNIRNAAEQLLMFAAAIGPHAKSYVPAVWSVAPPMHAPTAEELDALQSASFTFNPQKDAINRWPFSANIWVKALDQISDHKYKWQRLISERDQAEKDLATALQLTPLNAQLTALSRQTIKSKVSDLWHELFLEKRNLDTLSFVDLLKLSGNRGVSAQTQNEASRLALAYAVSNPMQAHRLMGFAGSQTSPEFFEAQIYCLNHALKEAEKITAEIDPSIPTQLIGFGNHDDYLTAAISIGDLDTASAIGVGVSGMRSNVGNMGETLPGVINVFKEAHFAQSELSVAAVHWIGYRSPKAPWYGDFGVFTSSHAQSGAVPLASFIDELYSNRQAHSGPEIKNLTVFAFSYGSTTATEALRLTNHTVDNYITYGSAGVSTATVSAAINADNFYATHADGDGIAQIGSKVSRRLDPREIDGVRVFDSEGALDGKRVTAHEMYTTAGTGSILNWQKRGYLSDDASSLRMIGKVLAHHD